jgi:hypothetical protein
MNLTLGKEDRRAVDLLLDRSARAQGTGNGKGHAVYASADPTLGHRISQAHRLLQLLELLPGTEPPVDLVARTVRYVEEYSHRPAALRGAMPFLSNTQRPHA